MDLVQELRVTLKLLDLVVDATGLSRAHRNQTEADLQIVATAMKASLIIGGMVAVAANAIGPWIINLLFGERYMVAGECTDGGCTKRSWTVAPEKPGPRFTWSTRNTTGARYWPSRV